MEVVTFKEPINNVSIKRKGLLFSENLMLVPGKVTHYNKLTVNYTDWKIYSTHSRKPISDDLYATQEAAEERATYLESKFEDALLAVHGYPGLSLEDVLNTIE